MLKDKIEEKKIKFKKWIKKKPESACLNPLNPWPGVMRLG